MICLLYRDVLCLAHGSRYDQIYTVVACIDIHNATVEDVDNGRGRTYHLLLELVADIGFFRLAVPPSALLMETGL